jgi:hypothetical protein
MKIASLSHNSVPLIILHTRKLNADTQIKFSDWDVYGMVLYVHTVLCCKIKPNQFKISFRDTAAAAK